MSKNDDLFMVIVGDDDESVSHVKIDPNIQIKQEIEDVHVKVEELLDTAAEHGEILEFDDDEGQFQIKSEYVDNNIYFLEDEEYAQESDRQDSDVEYNYNEDLLNHEDDDDYESEKETKTQRKTSTVETVKRKRTHFWRGKPREIVSYVQYLRDEYQDLRDDDELLISCIAELMKKIQRPAPPQDYYTLDGDMLECVYCHQQSTSIPNAQRHYQEKHGERYLYCYACGTDFRSSTNLYKHEKRCDAPDINYVLKARARSLGRKARSRPFIPINPASKNKDRSPSFQCTECSASFVTKYGLESHLRMHRGERPYACPHCPRAYTSQTTLARHKLKHGSQQFICDHCGRSFKLKAALILHMDTHAPLKKFPCAECSRRYSQKSALLVHVNRDHRNLPLPFPCQICPKRYPRMSVLKTHMKKEHGMLIMTRKMFFKQLPILTKTQIEQAKIILKTTDDPYNMEDSDQIKDEPELEYE